MANFIFSGLFIGTSIQAHGYYTTLPYHILLSIARYAGIYRHAAGPCGSDIGTSIQASNLMAITLLLLIMFSYL